MRKLGIGLGSMELLLDTDEFECGELLEGRVRFALEKPTEARGLFVAVTCEQETLEERVHARERQQRRRTEIHHSDRRQLDGQRIYTSGDVPFGVPLPRTSYGDHRPHSKGGGVAQSVVDFAFDMLTHPSARPRHEDYPVTQMASCTGSPEYGWDALRIGPAEWKLAAYIDIPWGRDLATSRPIWVVPQGRSRRPYRSRADASSNPPPPPPPPTPIAKRPKFCNQCGGHFEADDKFCQGCGKPR